MKKIKKVRTLTAVLATALSSCGTISSYYDLFDKKMPYGEPTSEEKSE